MKKSIVAKLLFVAVALSQLSGCVVRPWWGDGDRGNHYGESHHNYYHGDHHDDDWGHDDHY